MREGTRPYRRLGRCCSRPLGPAEATEPGGQPRLSAGGCRLGWPGTQRRRGKAPGGASDVGSARLRRGAPQLQRGALPGSVVLAALDDEQVEHQQCGGRCTMCSGERYLRLF